MEEVKKFARWMIIQTEEVKYTQGPCRRFNNKVYTVDENIYMKIQTEKNITPNLFC